jgi:FKBP-type peptidyl-prolyl cis-trans isomerase
MDAAHGDMGATTGEAMGGQSGEIEQMHAALQQAFELGLNIEDNKVGDGTMAKPGDVAVVHYTGWLFDQALPEHKGDKFDSSHDRGQPFEFPLGGGRVIKGWDLGVVGMKVGGERTLIIPSELAYGERGTPGGPIPPNATLVFAVELLDLK